MSTVSPFERPRNPGDCFSAPRRQVKLGKNVLGKIFMDVIDDSFSARTENKPNWNQFGVMKVVDICRLLPRFAVNPPNGTGHPRESRFFSFNRFDIDMICDGIHWMRANDGYSETSSRQRPAFPVENAGVESGVNRRHVNGDCSVHGDAVLPRTATGIGRLLEKPDTDSFEFVKESFQ